MWLARTMLYLLLAYSAVSDALAFASEAQRLTLTSGDHVITMEVRFSKPYAGTRLAFHSDGAPRDQICFVGNGESGRCLNHFVGAVATVTFTLKRAGGKLSDTTRIREHVTVL